jgi:hypothetical protein
LGPILIDSAWVLEQSPTLAQSGEAMTPPIANVTGKSTVFNSEQRRITMPRSIGTLLLERRFIMLARRTYWLCLGILMAVAFVLAGFGPGWMSGSTFGWIGAVVIAVLAVSLLTIRAAQPTRSVAHVLYDAEHQKDPRR